MQYAYLLHDHGTMELFRKMQSFIAWIEFELVTDHYGEDPRHCYGVQVIPMNGYLVKLTRVSKMRELIFIFI